MKILITGVCGFVGSTLARALLCEDWVSDVIGIDNLSRKGSETNRHVLGSLGVRVIMGDLRCTSDVESLPRCDVVIDAAANASVLAGVDGATTSRQLMEHNLLGTINVLEYCKQTTSTFILLSTSRVYSIPALAKLRMIVRDDAFFPDVDQRFPDGISPQGVSESYSTQPPVSLYGSTKVTSEHLALEYGSTFGFPVWINRCGVMAGPGQFGHPAQGIFSYWIHSFREARPLKYIGFGGQGHQVRDCLHPQDLIPLLKQQILLGRTDSGGRSHDTSYQPRIINVAGGLENSMSLAQLTRWCQSRYPHSTTKDSFSVSGKSSDQKDRPFDIPWLVLDVEQAKTRWQWTVTTSLQTILEEIATFADAHPDHLLLSQ